MADQDTSKFTPAPYKGAKGRLQALNQQLAGASTASGGSGSQTALRPLMAGIEAQQKASQQASEVASQISGLRREQQADSIALQETVRDKQIELAETPTAMDTINLAVTGAMTLEALSDRVADGMSKTEKRTKRVKVGTQEYTDPETGEKKTEDVYDDISYEVEVDSGIGSALRLPSKILQKVIPSVNRMRSGQEEDKLARETEKADMAEYQAISTFQHEQAMEYQAATRDALATYNEDMVIAIGNQTDAIRSLNETLKKEIGKDPMEVFAEFNSLTVPKNRDIADPSGPKSAANRMWNPMSENALLAQTKNSIFRQAQGLDRKHPLGEELMMGRSELEPLKRVMFAGESNNSFSAMNQGGTKSTGVIGSTTRSQDVIGVDVQDLTIDEIRKRGKLPIKHPDRIFAVGRGQWVVPEGKGAFEEAVKAAGLKGTDKLTEHNQRKMEDEYILSLPVVKKYQRGEATVQEVQGRLAEIWKALKHVDTGMGTADDDGLNKASVDSLDVIKEIENVLMIGGNGRPGLPRRLQ